MLARCREINPDLPVIMVTGFPTIETATFAVRLNAYEYLTKPINNQKLIQSVGRAVEVKVLRDAKRLAEDEKRLYQRDLEMLVTARTERLVRSHKRYQLLFENSKDAIFMADWTGRFIAINRAAVDLFGHERSEMVLLQDRSLFPTSDSYLIFKRKIEQNGFVKDLHAQLQRKDNVLIDCLLTAHLIAYNKEIEGYQVIIRDVTLQKQAERKIQAQNAFLKNVIESLSHPFLVIDSRNFSVAIANSAARRGRSMAEMTCHRLHHGNGQPCSCYGIRCPVEAVIEKGVPVRLEHAHTTQDGRMVKHAVYAFPLFDEHHHVTQVIHYCIDITERKQLEAIAEAANLMENLGYIFSGIRHEIGNPVNSVKMALSVLSMNLDQYSKPVIQEFLQRAMGEISRMEYLLKSVKNFSMYETPNIEPVLLAPFIGNFIHLVEKDFAANGIRIKVKMPEKPLAVMTDDRTFHQVLLNLLTNAGDALKNTEHPEIQIVILEDSTFVQVQVIDNGCGMSENELSTLFRPFFTSKPQGTGLGLVIVKKMLSKMNSHIHVDSTPQQGTIVTLTIPQAVGEEVHATAEKDTADNR